LPLASLLALACATQPTAPPPPPPPPPAAAAPAPSPAPTAAAPTHPAYPPSRVEPVKDVLHGVTVADPYRWLEAAAHADVQAWMKGQDELTRAPLARRA